MIINIAGRSIPTDPGLATESRVFVIAEIGVNHDGRLDRALELVDAAADAGADAIKLQTFCAAALATEDAPLADYQRSSASSQHAMLERLELSPADHRMIRDHARSRGLGFLSTPFDEASVAVLDELDVDAIKISSGDLTHHALLRVAAATERPLILSTGMATIDDVHDAVAALESADLTVLSRTAILHCVSAYPASPADANLRAIGTLRRTFRCPSGWSDHTPGDVTAIAAVARGAAIIEKHLTWDRSAAGPDHAASLDPAGMRSFIERIREASTALGDGVKRVTDAEVNTRDVARRSVVAARSIPAGATIDRDMLAVLRPAGGLPPSMIENLPGRRAATNIAAGEQIELAMLQ